jgi:hypothetical protein
VQNPCTVSTHANEHRAGHCGLCSGWCCGLYCRCRRKRKVTAVVVRWAPLLAVYSMCSPYGSETRKIASAADVTPGATCRCPHP